MEDIKCLFGLHKYVVHKEEILTDLRGNVVGKTIISRCERCGKIKSVDIITSKNY